MNVIKVAEHSFQEPMPISPFRLSYLCFGARFLQESRFTTEEFILAFLAKVCAVAMATGMVKGLKNGFYLLKKIQSLDFFHRLPTTNSH